MDLLNLRADVKNPLNDYKIVNWWQSRVNIIYIPFSMSKFQDWYYSDPHVKQHYHNIIIPDNVTLGSIRVRNIQKYVAQLKKEIKNIRVDKIIKNSNNTPVIVDLSPVANTFWQIMNSRGIRYTAPDFFNFVNSIYTMLVSSKQLGATETVVVMDFTNEYQDLEKLLLYIKLNNFQLPVQIADRFVLLRHNNIYNCLTVDSSMQVPKNVFSKISKMASSRDDQIKNLDTNSPTVNVEDITEDKIKNVLLKKFNKKIDSGLEIDSILNITRKFVDSHPDIEVNIGDDNELAELIKNALSTEIKVDGNPQSIDTLLAEHRKQFVYKKDIDSNKIHNPKTIGIDAIKATGVKWVTDSSRTKVEFDQNLDRNIEKLIESLDDKRFGLQVLGIQKEISDDGRSRFYNYKIKIKPDGGRTYYAKLKIPALVHDTYFKIGGNLYAINNQLMQLPIIKKNANTVQLKTNYSVTDYTIKSFPLTVKSFSDIVDKFLNSIKSIKKLKTAEVMDSQTEARMKEYGIPVNEIARINYKKIETKT